MCFGATVDECSQLLRDVDDLARFARMEDVLDENEELIGGCRLHFAAYARYLDSRDRFKSYAQYLAEVHGIHQQSTST